VNPESSESIENMEYMEKEPLKIKHRLTEHLPHLQFITSNPNHAEQACIAGCTWIQLRIKNAGDTDYLHLAGQFRTICDLYGAVLIINDNVDVAQKVKADGVHLGREDTPVAEARKLLGEGFIIGCTANTYDDVAELSHNGADYAGVGPFRFTTTKKHLSPILREKGYRSIISKCRETGINLPLFAIGGIGTDDIEELFSLGVYGIAVSSAIGLSGNAGAKTKNFLEEIEKVKDCCKHSSPSF